MLNLSSYVQTEEDSLLGDYEDLCITPSVEEGVSFSDDTLPGVRNCKSNSKLGLLSRLPLELLHAIFQHLDLPSIDSLLSISSETSRILQSQPHYAKLAQHAPHLLRTFAQVHSARHLTLKYIATSLLTSKSCSNCGAFAGFYSLLTDRRVCRTCICEEDEFEAWEWSKCSRHFELDPESIGEFKHVRPVRGRYFDVPGHVDLLSEVYSPIEYVPREGEYLVPAVKVRMKAGDLHGQYREELMFQQWLALHPRGAYRPADAAGSSRFACVVRIPWFRADGEVEWGVNCILCTRAVKIGMAVYGRMEVGCLTMYTKDEFGEHFRDGCPNMGVLEVMDQRSKWVEELFGLGSLG